MRPPAEDCTIWRYHEIFDGLSSGEEYAARSTTIQTRINGPTQRVAPFPDTVALLVDLGAVNNHHCVSCLAEKCRCTVNLYGALIVLRLLHKQEFRGRI